MLRVQFKFNDSYLYRLTGSGRWEEFAGGPATFQFPVKRCAVAQIVRGQGPDSFGPKRPRNDARGGFSWV